MWHITSFQFSVKKKLEMCPVGTRMPRQGVMSVTQNDFGEWYTGNLKQGICESEYNMTRVRCDKMPKFRR